MPKIDHFELRVRSLDIAEHFYDPVCTLLGYYKHHRMKGSILYRSQKGVGDLIIVKIRKAGEAKHYDRDAPGFSHMAWNASSRAEVDELHRLLLKNKNVILDPPCEMNYSPGYYAVWFQDPDGMKLELAHIPHQSPDDRVSHSPARG